MMVGSTPMMARIADDTGAGPMMANPGESRQVEMALATMMMAIGMGQSLAMV